MKKSELLLLFTVIASLFVHILFGVGMQHFDRTWSSPKNQTVEIIYKNDVPSKGTKRQVISKLENLQEQVNKLKNKVNRLSEKKVRVKEETVAARTGDKTKNRINRKSQHRRRLNRKRQQQKTKKLTNSDDFYKKMLRSQPAMQQQQMSGFSTTSDYIPNVKLGYATALNADQFTYYTFFERIKQQLRPRWVSKVRQVASSLTNKQLKIFGRKMQYTEVEVVLDQKGHLKKVLLVKASQSKGLDLAALSSFKEITPILNPPRGMVGNDGLVRIYYSFNVQLSPRPYVRNP